MQKKNNVVFPDISKKVLDRLIVDLKREGYRVLWGAAADDPKPVYLREIKDDCYVGSIVANSKGRFNIQIAQPGNNLETFLGQYSPNTR